MKPINGLRRVAVLGLGTMGHGIAQTFALAGWDVACFDESASARASLIERVRGNLAAFVAAGMVEPERVESALARLHATETEADAVTGAQFVTEAVFEDLAMKR